MDIEPHTRGGKYKILLNKDHERYHVSRLIARQLGLAARMLFAVKVTFSEDDLSRYPLTVTLSDTGLDGLHEAIQCRTAELQADVHNNNFWEEEYGILLGAASKIAKFIAPEAEAAA